MAALFSSGMSKAGNAEGALGGRGGRGGMGLLASEVSVLDDDLEISFVRGGVLERSEPALFLSLSVPRFNLDIIFCRRPEPFGLSKEMLLRE